MKKGFRTRSAAIIAALSAFWMPVHGAEAANTLRDAKAHFERAEYTEAIAIWEQLAHAGSGAAFYNLGQAYRNGHGTSASTGEAIGFFAQGGLQKHVESLSALATMLYFEVEGGRRNGDALTLWRAAARGRSAGAQYMLAVLHFNGQGIPQDSQLAYAWAGLATEKGFEEAFEARDRAKSDLTANALAQADLMAAALEGDIDFDTLDEILKTWARQAPQLAPVKVAAATTNPANPPKPRAPAPVSVRKDWRLQVGAFSSIRGAQLQLKKLSESAGGLMKGLQWSLLQSKRPGKTDQLLYRLRIGPFPSRALAEAKCEQIKPLKLQCFVVAP